MKFTAPLALLSLACVALARGQSAAADSKARDDRAERAISQLEIEWAGALLAPDIAAIDRIEAPDYLLTEGEGISDRATLDAGMKAGDIKYAAYHIDDLKVRIFGDMALAHGLETEKSHYKGEDTGGQYRYTDVFVKRGGAWVAVATQVSRVPKS